MENQEKLQELQMLEQTIQNLLMQKQAFQMEIAETNSAISELEKAGDDVFKIIGQLMIKTDKEKTKRELGEKQKILNLRITTLEKQESTFTGQLEKMREEIIGSSKK